MDDLHTGFDDKLIGEVHGYFANESDNGPEDEEDDDVCQPLQGSNIWDMVELGAKTARKKTCAVSRADGSVQITMSDGNRSVAAFISPNGAILLAKRLVEAAK